MIPREKALEWAEDAGLPSLTDYGIECLIRLINHSNDEGQKAMRERAAKVAAANTCCICASDDIDHLEIE